MVTRCQAQDVSALPERCYCGCCHDAPGRSADVEGVQPAVLIPYACSVASREGRRSYVRAGGARPCTGHGATQLG
ncbi:MAG: hypothetical protein WDW38_002245 [Sanguina aurantia]